MQPQGVETTMFTTTKRLKNAKAATYYDRYSKDLEALEEGDGVQMRPITLGNKTWGKGIVHKSLDEKSYEEDHNEGSLRRNRVDLKKSSEKREEQGSVGENDDKEETKADVTKKVSDETKVETLKPIPKRSERTIKKPINLDL